MRALLRRLLDVYRHPGEYPTQRQYRRYLQGIDQAQRVRREPYVLSSVRVVTMPSSTVVESAEAMREAVERGDVTLTDTYWHDRVLRDRVALPHRDSVDEQSESQRPS